MAYKISMWIVIFLVSFNAGAGLLIASGSADYIGVSPDVCTPESVAQAGETTQNVDTGTGGGSTLFGFYNALADPLETAFDAIFPGAAMLKCAGIPQYIVNFAFAGLALVPGFDLILFLRRG